MLKKLKASKGDKHERKKEQKRIETTRQHLKVLIKFVKKDYADIKNRSVSAQWSLYNFSAPLADVLPLQP